MIELLKWLIMGHSHKWKVVKEQKLVDTKDTRVHIGDEYICACEKCGAMKRYRF